MQLLKDAGIDTHSQMSEERVSSLLEKAIEVYEQSTRESSRQFLFTTTNTPTFYPVDKNSINRVMDFSTGKLDIKDVSLKMAIHNLYYDFAYSRILTQSTSPTSTTVSTSRSLLRVLTDKLREIAEDCADPEWDGYDALPVSKKAIQRAEVFIDQIENLVKIHGLLLPEISPTPDGSIIFDWEKDGNRFSLAISEKEYLFFAFVGISKRIKGREQIKKSLSSEVRELILTFIS